MSITTSLPVSWTLDHIGIAVSDLENALKPYIEIAGFSLEEREALHEMGIDIAFISSSDGQVIELLAPQTTNANSALSRFLAKRGQGLHHICYRVHDINLELKRLNDSGIRCIDRQPRNGSRGTLIAFLHPDSFNGVLIEISQKIAAL